MTEDQDRSPAPRHALQGTGLGIGPYVRIGVLSVLATTMLWVLVVSHL